MTLTLSIISLVSLATTGALLIYVARLLRDERERADARVAALSAAIWRDDLADGRPFSSVGVAAAPSDLSVPRHEDTAERLPVTETPVEDSPTNTGAASYESRSMFADSVQDARRDGSRRWLAPVFGVLIVTGLIAAGALATMDSNDRAEALTVTDERLHDAPLELLSLRHQREGNMLTVSGLVRNPSGAPAHEHTDVVVFTFDRTGAFVTSARAALADPSLGGGSESPFSATIPNGANVGRYRISFRTGERMLPHVDRRQSSRTSLEDAPAPQGGTDNGSMRSTP
jgi:hypothetical protein